MAKNLAFLLLVLLFFSCKNTKTSETLQQAPKLPSENIYNLSSHPEVLKLKSTKILLTDIKISKKFNFDSNYRSHFMSVSFPFSFYVNSIFVQKGDAVKKGDRLFDIKSDALNNAIIEYKKTGNENIAKTINNIGISTNSATPITNIYLTAPEDGVLMSVNVEAQKNYPPQELATIKLTADMILEGTVPASTLSNGTNFLVIIGDKEMQADIISQETKGNAAKIKLSVHPTSLEDDFSKAWVKAVTTLSNVSILPREAILVSGDKTYVFVDKGEGIVEKRAITGFFNEEGFVVTENLFENEVVFIEGVGQLSKLTH